MSAKEPWATIERLAYEKAQLLAERDELLAALKDLESRRILDCLVQPACGDCSCCRAFAVIAKAEGES